MLRRRSFRCKSKGAVVIIVVAVSVIAVVTVAVVVAVAIAVVVVISFSAAASSCLVSSVSLRVSAMVFLIVVHGGMVSSLHELVKVVLRQLSNDISGKLLGCPDERVFLSFVWGVVIDAAQTEKVAQACVAMRFACVDWEHP